MSKKTAPKKSAKKSAKPAQAKSAPKKVLPAAKKAAVGKKTPPAKKAAAVSAAKNGAAAPARRVIASVKPDKLAKMRESVNAKAQPKRIAQATISAPKPAAQKKTENVKKTSKKTAEKKPAKTEKTKAAASVAEKTEKPQKADPAPKEPERQFAAPASKRKKAHLRPSHNIYFSIEDLNAYFEKREAQTERVQKEKSAAKKTASAASAKPVTAPAVPKKPLAVATIFDILGLNPVVAQTHEKLDEQDVPRKWKKYYKMLVDLRKHHSSGVEQRSEEVLKRSAKDDAGDLSSYGQHLADAGSESFERDMAYNLISNQKEVLSEIEEAIKRIKNGTYGICEITGKPIPESRLMSIPYTRCTKEGQEIKEREAKRIKASQRSALYDMGDGSSSSSSPDEEAGS